MAINGFLLDTNVISELNKPRPDKAVQNWYDVTPVSALYLSTLVLGEIRAGIVNVRDRKPVLAQELEQWLKVTRKQFNRRILPVSDVVADCWGDFIANNKNHVVDALFAATAKCYGLTLVTRNIKHIAHHPIEYLSPWDYVA